MIALTRHAVAYPAPWLLGLALLTGLLGAGLLRLELRTEGDALRPAGAPVVARTAADRARFEEPRRALLLVTCEGSDACLATPAGFRFLRALDRDLRRLPSVRGPHVVSLAGLPRIERTSEGESPRFSLGSWLDEIPDEPTAFAALLADVRREPATSGLLLAADGTTASLDVPLAEDRPVRELVGELAGWIAQRKEASLGVTLRLTGPEVAEATLGSAVLRDLAVLVPLMLLAIAVLLYVTLGTLAGVAIPLLEAELVLVWTLGAMGWLGVPVTLVTTVLPVLLMAMAIADEIHLLERLQRQTPERSTSTAVVAALEAVGRPIVLTSITTALGFLSFLTAAMTPLRHFGLFAAFGILVAMALTFTAIPALLVCLPARWLVRRRSPRTGSDGDRLQRLSLRYPGPALALAAGLVLVSVPGLALLRVQDSWVANFGDEAPIAVASRTFDRAFWGQYRFDVVLEGEPHFFYTAAGAALVRALERGASEAPQVGGAQSYLDPLGAIARALGRNTPPDDHLGDLATLAELSSHRLALRQLVTDDGAAARVRLFVPDADYERGVALEARLDPLVRELARDAGVEAHTSGDLPVATEVVHAIVRNQVRSIALTLVAVTLVLSAFFVGPRVAIVAVAPATAAVAILLGGMGYAGLALGIATSMFASLTVGVGVDFGIHFLHRYVSQRRFGRDHAAALATTVEQVGPALRANALVLAAGFLVLCTSGLRPNRDLGLLLAGGVVVCFGVTLLALPRLARLAFPSAGLVLALLASAPGASAGDGPCDDAERAPSAQALMSRIESKLRGLPRIVRMTLHDPVDDSEKLDPRANARPSKPLWGVFDGDPERTRILYVFTGPGRLAGTTLLLEDARESVDSDRMWLYLRMFGSFTELDGSFRDVFVPGTVLTYEDARAFLPGDKYRFVRGEGSEVHACPRTPALARELGYRRLRIVVDADKLLVREIAYHDVSDRILKHYRLRRERRIGDHWLPAEIGLEHRGDATYTLMELEHWLPDEAPPASLYDASVEREVFLPRLRRYLARQGLDARLATELERSEAQAHEWDARFENGR